MYSNYGQGQPSAPGAQYGQNPMAPGNFGVNPEVQQFFEAVDQDRSGRINASELQAALINGQGKNFSDSVCHMMVKVFGREQKGTISLREFQPLYDYVNNWISTFRAYDRDESGYIEEPELNSALQQMGYRFSPQFYQAALFTSAQRSNITVDEFIEFCMKLQRFTEVFKTKDVEQKGIITLGYEEFMNICFASFA